MDHPSFTEAGKVSFIIDGQFGSTGKGAMAAYLSAHPGGFADYCLTNAAPNAGHTSIHNGVKRVLYHLPTCGLVQDDAMIGLTAGAAIDIDLLNREIEEYDVDRSHVMVHPNAAVITDADKLAEGAGSGPANIASTQKGVGSAFARRIMRSGRVAKDYHELSEFVHRWYDFDLVNELRSGAKMTMEIPQGRDLSLTSQFYPHVTSRNVSVAQALSDLRLHPSYLGKTAMSLRSYPIRVGDLDGRTSGPCWEDQNEISWEDIGREPEITTVTGRKRRIFSWSLRQTEAAMREIRPDIVWLSFCDYLDLSGFCLRLGSIYSAQNTNGITAQFLTSFGPETSDVRNLQGALDYYSDNHAKKSSR